MLQVFRDQFSEHKYVIQIYITKLRHTMECLVHEPLEYAGCIGQPKGHDLELKQTKFTSKCCPGVQGLYIFDGTHTANQGY